MTSESERAQGMAAGIGCYLLWGLFPLYWKLLDHVDSLEVTAQRVIWCFALTAIICLIARWNFTSLLKDKRALCYLIPAAIIITSNWGTYIFAVHIDHIVEASLGYYINPLVSILLGLVIFKERLSPLQWIAVALCCIGILYFTISYGSFPWLAIYLALSFGVYGAIKKKGGYPAVEAIAVESAVMAPVAIVFGRRARVRDGKSRIPRRRDERHGMEHDGASRPGRCGSRPFRSSCSRRRQTPFP